MTPIIDIGVACAANQQPVWWAGVWSMLFRESQRGTFQIGQIFAHQSAMPDGNKNNTIGGVLMDPNTKNRNNKTDVNRQIVTGYFLEGGGSGVKADYLFWMDDDTVPPDGAITKLLRMDRPIAAGVYFNTNPPFNPIAYRRLDNGGYKPVWDYPPGAVMEIDCVGMGCTLIHRSVYEKIQEEHTVFQRPNASLVPIHKSKISVTGQGVTIGDMVGNKQERVIDGYLVQKLVPPDLNPNPVDHPRLFPFYVMEQNRTEDMYFCELASDVGIKPWLDTSILCEHWKHKPTTYDDYRQEFIRREIDGSTEKSEVAA
jgi:hypothetical protein